MFECICWCLYPKVSCVYPLEAIVIMSSAGKYAKSTNWYKLNKIKADFVYEVILKKSINSLVNSPEIMFCQQIYYSVNMSHLLQQQPVFNFFINTSIERAYNW